MIWVELQMTDVSLKTVAYESPKVVTLDREALGAVVGPSLSCTGFGGSVSC